MCGTSCAAACRTVAIPWEMGVRLIWTSEVRARWAGVNRPKAGLPSLLMRIIDCHLHLNGYGAMEGLTLAERVDGLRAQLRKWGVGHGIVLSSYLVNETRPSTQEIL